jgi:hypothetical protein
VQAVCDVASILINEYRLGPARGGNQYDGALEQSGIAGRHAAALLRPAGDEVLRHWLTLRMIISEGLHIKRDCVFIIPPGRDLHVLDGEVRPTPLSKTRGWPM